MGSRRIPGMVKWQLGFVRRSFLVRAAGKARRYRRLAGARGRDWARGVAAGVRAR